MKKYFIYDHVSRATLETNRHDEFTAVARMLFYKYRRETSMNVCLFEVDDISCDIYDGDSHASIVDLIEERGICQ